MDDKQIVDLYWARHESAIVETDKKYGKYCRYIANNILGNIEDAKEIVNDTYLKTWETIPPSRPENLCSYVGMISRQLAINKYKSTRAKKRGGETECIISELTECVSNTNFNVDNDMVLREALNCFVNDLPNKTQKIFIIRYWYASDISSIAKQFNMSESSVTVLLCRTRKKLKEYLEREGLEI